MCTFVYDPWYYLKPFVFLHHLRVYLVHLWSVSYTHDSPPPLPPFSSVPSTLLRANEIMLSDDESEIEDEMDTQSEQDFSNEPSAGERGLPSLFDIGAMMCFSCCESGVCLSHTHISFIATPIAS